MHALIHVQHLKGSGHHHRSAAIARALVAHGVSVTYASGGPPGEQAGLDGVEVERLPIVRADGPGFANLVDERGEPIDDAWRARRREATLALLARTQPDVLVLETFPFGRRKLRFELLALLDAAACLPRPPAVLASVRDVPEPRARASEREEMVALARRHFDCVLVHGDRRVVRLEQTFPEAGILGDRVVYTGYVVDERARRSRSQHGRDEIIVSAGGGAAGTRLLETAIAAAGEASVPGLGWRILVGPNADAHLLRVAAAGAGPTVPGLVIERNRGDFPGLLRACAVSVSQAGYNTMLDVVCARARAVLVPYQEGGEGEQTIRARLFAARGLASVLDEPVLTPASLARAVAQAARAPRPPDPQIDIDGARHSAEHVIAFARDRS